MFLVFHVFTMVLFSECKVCVYFSVCILRQVLNYVQ